MRTTCSFRKTCHELAGAGYAAGVMRPQRPRLRPPAATCGMMWHRSTVGGQRCSNKSHYTQHMTAQGWAYGLLWHGFGLQGAGQRVTQHISTHYAPRESLRGCSDDQWPAARACRSNQASALFEAYNGWRHGRQWPAPWGNEVGLRRMRSYHA